MNTVAKGSHFENRVFNAIKRELDSERLGLLPTSCKIFKKKKYYSKNRKADIELDISIEVFLPNASSWSFLWAIECKDYKGALPVNDVEEFHAKIQQIAGDNVKATLILSGALQKSALEYCKSLGIGVVRLLSNNRLLSYVAEQGVEYNTKRSRSYLYERDEAEIDANNPTSALTEPQFMSENQEFFAFQNNCFYKDWFSLIEATLSKICANK
jgi:hypothetical protein